MILEQEIKLSITDSKQLNLRSLEWLYLLSSDKSVSKKMVSTYFDLKGGYLMRQGLGLRLRKSGDQWLQTVKTSGSVNNGLHERQEWEHELENEAFDLDKLKQTPLKPIIENKSLWSDLKPIFTTDFVRETLQLSLVDNTQIEFAYDRGEVRAKHLSVPIHEIEMELKTGSVVELIAFAEMVTNRLSLQPSDCSKAQLGYQLVKALRN